MDRARSDPSAATKANLWREAPAWRTVALTAAGLTATAIALYVAAPNGPSARGLPSTQAQVATAAVQAPRPAAAPRTSGSPPQVAEAPAPPVIIVEKYVQGPAPASAPPPAAAPAPLQVPAAPAQTVSSGLPGQETMGCALRGPPAPLALGAGTVEALIDRDTAVALVGLSEAQAGGKIDPNYMDNQRVTVRLDNGRRATVLIPKPMVVRVGDRVTVQSSYRNAQLPCNYIPNLATADLGPAQPRAADSASPP